MGCNELSKLPFVPIHQVPCLKLTGDTFSNNVSLEICKDATYGQTHTKNASAMIQNHENISPKNPKRQIFWCAWKNCYTQTTAQPRCPEITSSPAIKFSNFKRRIQNLNAEHTYLLYWCPLPGSCPFWPSPRVGNPFLPRKGYNGAYSLNLVKANRTGGQASKGTTNHLITHFEQLGKRPPKYIISTLHSLRICKFSQFSNQLNGL